MADLLISTPDGDFGLPVEVQTKLALQLQDPANIIGAVVANVASSSRNRANHTGKQDPLTSLTGATSTGVAVLTAASQTAGRTAIDAASTADAAARLRPRGAFAAGVAYAVNDVVISGGVAFYALIAHTSANPAPTATSTYWQMLGGGTSTGTGTTFVPSYDNALAGSTFTLVAPFPASRPTTRTDIAFLLKAASTVADPAWLLPIDTRLVVG